MSYNKNAGISTSYKSNPLSRISSSSTSNLTKLTSNGSNRRSSVYQKDAAHQSKFDFGGRSYVIASTLNSGRRNSFGSPAVHSAIQIDEQTANSANIGVVDNDDIVVSDEVLDATHKSTPEFYHPPEEFSPFNPDTYDYSHDPHTGSLESDPLLPDFKSHYDPINPFHDYESEVPEPIGTSPKLQSANLGQLIVKPFQFLPAVFLGTLLNVLDGLSYGMIMFPVSEAIFASLAPAGLSMFYMSCIVSQLVFSLGGSAFKSGIGSEMIEVTPFFHTMAFAIMSELGDDKDAIIATTIVTYAVSSMVTGATFYLLGKLKLGSLVGFFPRHILVGCIGGVGYFLVVTGIEVSSKLDGGVVYNPDTFNYLFGDYVVLLRWTIPLVLTVILILIQHRFHNSIIVPLFFISVFVLFHLVVMVVPSLNLDLVRDFGFVFSVIEDNEPWYGFYLLYKFRLVDWWCITRQIPSMLALTFFGILHVPINVPALAVTVGMDPFDVDRELVAHGYSNFLSGLCGSIQNYLVYTNSVLFIRAGADDRLAGVLLAIATGVVMMVGPVVIGYIPICVVGSLIYLLGYELLKEALYDTYGKLARIEYSTILIIVITMGAWDFVYGILAGILLACLSFVIEAATTPVVQGMYTGVVARSTVLRHPKQQEFLKAVGNQICIVKLQGTLFFGSIGGVEAKIRSRFEVDNFKADPVKFLILDMKGIISIDFSASEGFRRILNLANDFNTQLIISSVQNNDDTVKALRDAGLWDGDLELPIQLFNTLNYALEWCESSYLVTYKNIIKQKSQNIHHLDYLGMTRNKSIVKPITSSINQFELSSGSFSKYGATPRTTQVYQAANKSVRGDQSKYITNSSNVSSSFAVKPLPLLMLAFHGLSNQDEEFWSKLAEYLIKEQVPENYCLYETSVHQPAFFIVETGLIKSVINFESDQSEFVSTILPSTAFGDLFECKGYRSIVYITVSETVVWKLTKTKLQELLALPDGLKVYNELLMIQSKLTRERFDTLTANLILS